MPRAPSTFRQQDEMPRCLTVEGAAAYAGCRTISAFRDWVRRGIMPGPLPGTHRYDRKAIDAALDRLSGLSATMVEVSEYEAWKQRRANTGQGN
jgi:hypothetical protein